MTSKCLGKGVVIVSFLLSIAACTGSQKQDLTNIEVLSSQNVFATNSLMATSANPDGVVAINSDNRPIMESENCKPTEDDGISPTPTPSCQPGYTLQGDDCVSICKQNQIFAQEKCRDKEKTCVIENGTGVQTWMANTYGNCKPTQCNEAFEIKNDLCTAKCTDDEVYTNGQCRPLITTCEYRGQSGVKKWEKDNYGKCHVAQKCPIKNGSGLAVFDIITMKHKKCEVTNCKFGFKEGADKQRCVSICNEDEVYSGEKCLPKQIPCEVANGEGVRTWSKSKKRYQWCMVSQCNQGFERAGNSCREPRSRGNADPLIVDLGADQANPAGISLTSQIQGILFDILGVNSNPSPHAKKQISWTDQQRYQWVVKPNQEGQVLGINEMFGDNTLGPDGTFAAEGFQALSKYDTDKNGIIDVDDPVYNELALWHDANKNGISDLGELTSFSTAGISSIDLNYDPNFFEVDQYGNKTTYKSVVKFYDGKKTLIFDLWFKYFDQAPNDNGDDNADNNDGGNDNPVTPPGECPKDPTIANNF